MTAAPEPSGRIWLLVDDRPGHRTQVLGVGDALGGSGIEQRIGYRRRAELPNALLGATFAGLDAASRAHMVQPWPDLVIAAGRRTAPVARAIKRRSEGRTAVCQLMDPGPPWSVFDLIAIPRHDRPPEAANVLPITGAPHRLTPSALDAARSTWLPRFAELPKPRVALLVGGTVRRRVFAEAMARDLGVRVSNLVAEAGGSLLVSTSRRTGDAATEALLSAVKVPSHVFRWSDAGENPYLGFVSCADAIVVTGDSVSMLCEACAASVPVFVYAPPSLISSKHARLHADVFEHGYAQPLSDTLDAPAHSPLNAAADVASEIVRRRLLG